MASEVKSVALARRTPPKRPHESDDDEDDDDYQHQDQPTSRHQPAPERARAPLSFSIESIMQSSQQQVSPATSPNTSSNNNNNQPTANHHHYHHHHHQADTSTLMRGHRIKQLCTESRPAPSSSSTSTGRLNQVECVLDNKDMWDKFHSLNTEMIITKTGRRMFPVLKVQFHNLDPSARYAVSMDIVPVDNKRYRYAYHKSCWQVAGKADPSAEPRLYPHPDSPFNGELLSRQVISFEKVKLTNNEMDKSGHIILNSMHKYQPRVHLIELKSTLVAPPQQQHQPPSMQQIPSLNGKLTSSRYQQQYQQQQHRNSCQPQPQLDIEGYRTFVFPETVFTAVTAYQNQLITKMKIDKNPFAKGFRDSSRLSDLDRNDPFEGFMNLGPAAAAAAAAACAAGRYPGGPGGSGPGGMPPGSFEAAAAAAAGMPPGNPGQMDQAYAQLLASAAAANSPWYSATAAANPFQAMGSASACSTAQAAQIQATQMQMWLAAFSACLNNAGQQLNQLPPSPPGGGPIPNHDSFDPTGQLQQQECRDDSRSSSS